jgi:hypothetical protein
MGLEQTGYHVATYSTGNEGGAIACLDNAQGYDSVRGIPDGKRGRA